MQLSVILFPDIISWNFMTFWYQLLDIWQIFFIRDMTRNVEIDQMFHWDLVSI